MAHEYPGNFARFYDVIYNQLRNQVDHDFFLNGEYEPGKRMKRTVSTKPDLINQLIHIHFKLDWEENNQWMHEDWKLPFRFFFRYELGHLVERSDFENYEILGNYQGNALNEDSKEFIMVCRKK